MKKLSFKDFTLELSYYTGNNNFEKWVHFLEELGVYADYNWDIPKMQYDLVKSDKEWEEFKSHPERQPFRISVTDWHSWSIDKVYERALEALQVSITLYKDKKTPADIRLKIKLSLSQIMKGILHSRYDKYLMELEDTYEGITTEMRSTANLSVTPIQVARFNYRCKLVAEDLGMHYEEVRKLLLDACQQDLARLGEFTLTCQFTDLLKNIFVSYRKHSSSDHTLSNLSMKLGFRIWKEFYTHGLDIDTYLELLGYPKAQITKKRLYAVIDNKEIISEIHQHLKQERPESYKHFKKFGYVPSIDIGQEEAKLFNYPKQLRSQKETQEMIERCRKIVCEYFPISKNESPRQIMFNATHPFSVKRAYQSQTENSNRQVINITVMTPTSDSENDYLETLAHETTHAIHSIILNRGEEFKVLTKQQVGQVPTGVLEDFSQLVEGQFKNASNTGPSGKAGKYFASLNQALGSRWQAPYGIIQIEIREYFEKLFKKGVTELTNEMIDELRLAYTKKIRTWWEEKLGLQLATISALNAFSPIAPYDGLVYMKRFILPQKSGGKTKKEKAGLSMNDALITRFGKKWIDSQDGRILLYWLLLETGRNHATENYGEIILQKDISECLEELQKIGIDASEFSKSS